MNSRQYSYGSAYFTLVLCACMMFEINCRSKDYKNDPRLHQSDKVQLVLEGEIKLESSKEAFIGSIVEMVIDSDGSLLIADALDGSIKIFNSDGKYISSLSKGSKPKMTIMGFCVNKQGNIFVSDLLTSSIYEFSRTGFLVNHFPADSESRFILGIPRIFNNRLYVGVIERKYELDFYKSSIIRIYDATNGRPLKRFGEFDEIYKKIGLLSPEVHFDVTEQGIIYVVQCHSFKIWCYDSSGEHIMTFGEKAETFREAASAVPKDKGEYLDWLTTWSNLGLVKATQNFIVAEWGNRFKSTPPKFRNVYFIDVYEPDGKLIDNGIPLAGRLLFAKGDLLYIGTDLESDDKVISIFRLQKSIL